MSTRELETMFPRIEAGEEVLPEMTGYRMKCCECGLIHVVDFSIKKVVSNDSGDVWAEDFPAEDLRVVLSMVREDEPGSDGDELLRDLDTLLSVQGRLVFSRERFDEGIAEVFGVAVMEFMREHGMSLRRRLSRQEKPNDRR